MRRRRPSFDDDDMDVVQDMKDVALADDEDKQNPCVEERMISTTMRSRRYVYRVFFCVAVSAMYFHSFQPSSIFQPIFSSQIHSRENSGLAFDPPTTTIQEVSGTTGNALSVLKNSTDTHQSHRRLFLGIWTNGIQDGKKRNAVRKSYLKEHQQPFKVCSIADMHPDCHVVYAFISNVEAQGHKRLRSDDDILFLHRKDSNPVKAMYKYLAGANMLRTDKSTSPSDTIQFDFVAHAASSICLYPDRVWPPELFDEKDDTSVFAMPQLYAGVPRDPRPKGRSTFHGYSILSSKLVERIWKSKHFVNMARRGFVEETVESALRKEVKLFVIRSGLKMQLPDKKATAMVYLNNASSFALQHRDTDIVVRWDAYKDTHLVTYEDPKEEALVRSNTHSDLTKCHHGPRMLLGIMTVLDHELEAQRRKLIRETYLGYYNPSTMEANRVCALNELIDRSHPDHDTLVQDCQLAYTFVAGGNPDGPKELVELNGQEPLTLTGSVSEPDIAVLNIQENMKEGKSQTYFKYATTIIDEHLYFDYIAKADSDTIIYPDRLLNNEVNKLPAFPENVRVYGGMYRLAKFEKDDLFAPIYFTGGFYFLSVDLARYITSDECDRKALAVFSEDRSICNFVHSHPLPPRRIGMAPYPIPKPLYHPVKSLVKFEAAWKDYLGSNNTSFMATDDEANEALQGSSSDEATGEQTAEVKSF